jgi:small subunit ribosomal protein S2
MENENLEQEQVEELKEEFAQEINGADLDMLREMIGAGLIYGHNKSKTNPAFKPFIHANRNGIELIDLAKTLPFLDKAAEFLKNLIKEQKLILLVATQPAAREAAERLIKELNFASIGTRWIGGLMTNFENISKRISYFKKTKEGLAGGEFAKYTKKERLNIEKDLGKMEKVFGGLEGLSKMPDAIFLIDPSFGAHNLAMAEAKKCKIPVVALIDSDDNPNSVDYMIPANDHAKLSIDWVIDKIISKIK